MPTLADLQALRDQTAQQKEVPTLADLQALRNSQQTQENGFNTLPSVPTTESSKYIKAGANLLAPAIFMAHGIEKPVEHASMVAGSALGIPSKTIDLLGENYKGIESGVDQAFQGGWNIPKGIGNAALSTINLPFTPLQATVRKIYAEPTQRITGGLADADQIAFPAEMALTPAYSKLLSGPIKSVAHDLAYKSVIPNADKLREIGGGLFKEAEQMGGAIPPEATNSWINKIKTVVPQTAEGKIVAGENDVTKVLERIESLKDKPISLTAAQEIDESLGDLIDNFIENGRVKKQGKKLLDIQSNLRETMENNLIGGEKLKDARDVWATSRRMDDIERIVTRAEQSDNPATAMKSGFRTLYNNPSRMRGYTEEEKELIKKVAESGEVTDLLKAIGGKLLPIVTAASGGGFTGTAAATAASLASKSAATRLQVGRAQKLLDFMAKNASNKAGIPTEIPRF